MAGLGKKTFTAGEVLRAADVNSYLMDQSVMRFAGTAARGSAIGSAVSEGMVSWLNDLNQIQAYDGSAWQQVYPAKPLTGNIIKVVTASSTTAVASTANGFVSTGLVASITPSSTSNKIVVMVQYPAINVPAAIAAVHTIFRGTVSGTNLGNGTPAGFGQLYSAGGEIRTSYFMQLVDSPSTVSSVTYTAAFNPVAGNATVMHESRKGTITLMEVVA